MIKYIKKKCLIKCNDQMVNDAMKDQNKRLG